MSNTRPLTSTISFSQNSKQKTTISHSTRQLLSSGSKKLKEWQQISKDLNNQLKFCHFVNKNIYSYNSLSKFGNQFKINHHSSDRAIQSISINNNNNNHNHNNHNHNNNNNHNHNNHNHNNHNHNNHNHNHNNNNNHNNSNKKIFDNFRNKDKSHKIIKRISRQLTEIKNPKLYERFPIHNDMNKFVQQGLSIQHIQNIQRVERVQSRLMPIVYCIKSAKEVCCYGMNTLKNEQIPICISLFAECFDPKPQNSTKKRTRYFEQMLKQMGGTYDPQIMSKMPFAIQIRKFNNKQYYLLLQQFCLQLHQHQLQNLNQIIHRITIKYNWNPQNPKLTTIKKQLIQNLQLGISMSKLDYLLKNNKYNRDQIGQYLLSKKIYIISDKIKYHGGYSKLLYKLWNKYVSKGKIQLEWNNYKLNSVIQNVNVWMLYFDHINFIQQQLLSVIVEPVNIQFMKQLQKIKFFHHFNIFYQICIRGVLDILEFNKYCEVSLKGNNSYFVDQISKIQYIMGNKHCQGIFSLKQLNAKNITEWYTNFLQSRYKQKEIQVIYKDKQLIKKNDVQNFDICKKSINKSAQILLNIFYTNIIEKSLNSLIDMVMNPSKPLLKLNLIVDRQSLKIQQSEQKVVQTFMSIINQILTKKLRVVYNELGNNKNEGQQFRNLYPFQKFQQVSKSGWIWQLNISNKYAQIKEKQILEMIKKIKYQYNQSSQLIQSFSEFMPFIKLTAEEKILVHDQSTKWEKVKSVFLTNIQTIRQYRDKLSSYPKKKQLNLFSIQCSQPLKILHQRINQLDYLIQQKYLSRIYQKIQEIQLKITQIRAMIYSCSFKIHTEEFIELIFRNTQKQVDGLKRQIKELAIYVYFFIGKSGKSNTLVTRFIQLVNKRMELEKQIVGLSEKLREDSMFLENKREEIKNKFKYQISIYQQKLKNSCRQHLQISKLDQRLEGLSSIKSSIQQFKKQLNNFGEGESQFAQQYQNLQQTQKAAQIIYNYWNQMNQFNTMIKSIGKQSIKDIELSYYKKIVQESKDAIQQFQNLDIETNIINKPYLNTFKDQVYRYLSIYEYISILADKQIQIYYFAQFKCQHLLLNFSLKELVAFKNLQEYKVPLMQLREKAKAEHQILKNYEEIKQKFMTLKLVIVDFGGCDTLDPESTQQMVQTLHELCFNCEKLIRLRFSEKYKKLITQLYQTMSKCAEISLKWLKIQQTYLQLYNLIKRNPSINISQNNKNLIQIHKKIIKSFDKNNTIIQIQKNKILQIYLQLYYYTIQKQKQFIFSSFYIVQEKYFRLKLLTQEQMFQICCFSLDLEKYLNKCLPSIQHFYVGEEMIERVGGKIVETENRKDAKSIKNPKICGNYIFLKKPIALSSQLLNFPTWMSSLISQIKQTLRQLLTLPNDQCIQIQLLKQSIQFTKQIQQILLSKKQILHQLQNYYSNTLIPKIQGNRKRDYFKYNCQIKILLFLIQRDIVSSLIETSSYSELCINSFQWIKNCRFYNKSQKQLRKTVKPDIKMHVINQVFEYNFMFVEKCQFMIQDTLFIGNCVVGKKGNGKRSLIKNYAYLTGNQLFQFQSNRISSNAQQNIIDYFKLSLITGSWLIIPQIDKMSDNEIKLVGECLWQVNKAITSKLDKINMFGNNEFEINTNCKIYFTLQYLDKLPLRLLTNLRPIWICLPSTKFIISLYKQSLNLVSNDPHNQVSSNQVQKIESCTYKILDYLYWNRTCTQLPIYLSQSAMMGIENKIHKCINQIQNQFLKELACHKFILPQQLGFQGEKINDFGKVIENLKYAAIYLQQQKFGRVIAKLFEENSIVMNFQSDNLGDIDKKIQYIKRKVKKGNVSFLVLQNCVNYHKIIQKQFPWNQKTNNVKILYLQKLSNLSKAQKQRVLFKIPTLIYKQLQKYLQVKKNRIINKQVLMIKKINQLNQFVNNISYHFINKYLLYQCCQKEKNDVMGRFLDLFNSGWEIGFCREVATVFSVAWTFSNFVTQKQLISSLCEINELRPFHQILSKSTRLTQLFPLKNGFLSQTEQLSQTHKLHLIEGTFQFKSILLQNIKLILQLFPNKIMIIKSTQNIQQIINIIYPKCYHLYLKEIKSQQKIKNIIQHALKIGDNGKYQHFIIHSVDKLKSEIFQFVKSYAQRFQAAFIQLGEVKVFKSVECQFTFTTSSPTLISGSPSFTLQLTNQDILAYQQEQLFQIFKSQSTSRALCQKILREIIDCYYSYLGKYFWLKLPILITLKKGLRSGNMGNQLLMWLLSYIFLSVPDYKTKQITDIQKKQKPIALINHNQYESEIKSKSFLQSNTSIQHFLSKTELQIRRNICKQLIIMNQSNINITPSNYQMLYRTYIAVSDSHTILLGHEYSKRQFCLEIVARVLGVQILPFSVQNLQKSQQLDITNKKPIILIKQSDITNDILSILQSYICDDTSQLNRCYTVVLKLDENSQKIRKYYQEYSFLKKYFIHVLFHSFSNLQLMETVDLVKTLQCLDNGVSRCQLYGNYGCFDRKLDIQVYKNISQYLGTELHKSCGFLAKLFITKKQIQQQEVNKYKFYKNQTEQFLSTLIRLRVQYQGIPNKISELHKSLKSQQEHNIKMSIQQGALTKKMEEMTIQLQQINQLHLYHIDQKTELTNKIDNYKIQMEIKFKKIYCKLDGIGIQEHSKFREIQGNQIGNQIYCFVTGLIKWETGKLRKITSLRLKEGLKTNLMKGQKNKQAIKEILSIHKNQQKKSCQIAPIFIILLQWIENIDYYYFKIQDENDKIEQQIKNNINKITKQKYIITDLQQNLKQQQNKLSLNTEQKNKTQNSIININSSIQLQKQKLSRIQQILQQQTITDYKIKITHDLQQRFKLLPKIVMKKTIFQSCYCQFYHDYFIMKQLNLKQQHQLLYYHMDLYNNIFDDFGQVVEMYNKYRLEGMEYDEVKLIHAVIINKHKIQIIQDYHNILREKLCQVLQVSFNFKVLNLKYANMDTLKKQLPQKIAVNDKIVLNLSRFERSQQIKQLLGLINENCKSRDKVKFIIIFEKIQQSGIIQHFQDVGKGDIWISFRRYLKMFARMVYDKQVQNQWEYYNSEYEFSKLHKQFFEIVDKFDPQIEQSYNKISQSINKLKENKKMILKIHQKYQEYNKFLQTIYQDFYPFYQVLKLLEVLDRNSPIPLFSNDSIYQNMQNCLRKSISIMSYLEKTNTREILKEFIIQVSYGINFVNQCQLNQFCIFSSFILNKQKQVSFDTLAKLVGKNGNNYQQNQKIQHIIQENPCREIVEIMDKIKKRNINVDGHYFIQKEKLSMKYFRQKEFKVFEIIKIQSSSYQKFLQSLQKSISQMKEQIKLINYYFNTNKYQQNIIKLKQLSQSKIFIIIFNLNHNCSWVIDDIVMGMEKYYKGNLVWKIMFVTEDEILLRNRQSVEYVQYRNYGKSRQQQQTQRMQHLVQENLIKLQKKQKLQQNINILKSLKIIIYECLLKLNVAYLSYKFYNILAKQLLYPSILCTEGNVLKFIVDFFQHIKITEQQIIKFSNITQIKKQPSQIIPKSITNQQNLNVNNWVNLLKQIEIYQKLRSEYLTIIKSQINRVIQALLRGEPVKIILSETQIRQMSINGQIIIENAETLKFLIYKYLKLIVKDICDEETYEGIIHLKIICEIQNKTINLKLQQFNETLCTIPKKDEYILTIKVIEEYYEESLVQLSQIQDILKYYNVKFMLDGEKDILGRLFVALK